MWERKILCGIFLGLHTYSILTFDSPNVALEKENEHNYNIFLFSVWHKKVFLYSNIDRTKRLALKNDTKNKARIYVRSMISFTTHHYSHLLYNV